MNQNHTLFLRADDDLVANEAWVLQHQSSNQTGGDGVITKKKERRVQNWCALSIIVAARCFSQKVNLFVFPAWSMRSILVGPRPKVDGHLCGGEKKGGSFMARFTGCTTACINCTPAPKVFGAHHPERMRGEKSAAEIAIFIYPCQWRYSSSAFFFFFFFLRRHQ